MDVEVADASAANELTAAMPKVKDTLLLLLSSKSFEDISSMDRKIELKNQIVERLNQILGRGKVRNVYFTEFVVQ
jgi:flagellar FliL protein